MELTRHFAEARLLAGRHSQAGSQGLFSKRCNHDASLPLSLFRKTLHRRPSTRPCYLSDTKDIIIIIIAITSVWVLKSNLVGLSELEVLLGASLIVLLPFHDWHRTPVSMPLLETGYQKM